MNLIDLMKQRVVFDILEISLMKFSDHNSPYRYASPESKLRMVRKTIRNLPLKINNIKVTPKDKNKYIITFHSNNDRYYCIWDFAEGRYISRSVNR
jgi:hypothetical protein